MLPDRRRSFLFAFAFLLGALALIWQLRQRQGYEAQQRRGDGKHLASYGFPLTPLRIDAADIVPAGVPRDGLAALEFPARLDSAGLAALNARGRSAFLLGSDRVIGVERAGQALAYPLSILDWHEVVNDSLGGAPLLVTWNPLCGAACVYDPGARRFGVSGLFYASNLLLYDRAGLADARPAGGAAGAESLWSQLTGRALAGPAAARGDSLARLPFALTRWDDWRARHPQTRVIAPDPDGLARKYRRKPYTSYLGSDRLQYPVRRLPDTAAPGALRLKEPVLSVWVDEARRLYPLSLLAARAGAPGVWADSLGGRALAFRVWPGDPAVATVRAEGGAPLLSAVGFWFAWYAQEPAAVALLAR
ncbi:DUF3179 domain-containing protein [bacterium]|nr:DUF3179 domain-containing protein [bacterium]